MDTDNLKIVCIVQNIHNDSGRGLACAFNHSSDSQINAFISRCLYSFEGSQFITKFGHEREYKYLLFTKNDVIPLATLSETNNQNWEILFVCDSIAKDLYPKFIFKPNTLLMYHTTPNIGGDTINAITIDGETLRIGKGKRGEHADLPGQGYQLLLAITEAWKPNEEGKLELDKQKYKEAKQKIIDWFDLKVKLNTVLEFLHQSLGGTPANQSILAQGDEEFVLGKTHEGKKIKEWISALNNKSGDDYQKALRDVRDVLLKEAGETGEN